VRGSTRSAGTPSSAVDGLGHHPGGQTGRVTGTDAGDDGQGDTGAAGDQGPTGTGDPPADFGTMILLPLRSR
jgi:hypothetical protein